MLDDIKCICVVFLLLLKHFLNLFGLFLCVIYSAKDLVNISGDCKNYTLEECQRECGMEGNSGELYMNETGCPWIYSCKCIPCPTELINCSHECAQRGELVLPGMCQDDCCPPCACQVKGK